MDIFQIVVLIFFKNYLCYLIVGAVITFLGRLATSYYHDKKYPLLKAKDYPKLDKTELKEITGNIKSILVHKFSDTCIAQSDSLITSIFVGVKYVGLMSNYTLAISIVKNFASTLTNSVIASFGNLIVSVNKKEIIYSRFKCYSFLVLWIFGVCSILLMMLLSPVVSFVFGNNMLISNTVLFVYLLDFYFAGEHQALQSIKNSAGIFKQDQYLSVLRAIVNITVSVILVQKMGLIGVFIGTVVQRLIAVYILPWIINKNLFHIQISTYYKDSVSFFLLTLLSGALCMVIKSMIPGTGIISFLILAFLSLLIPNVIYYTAFRKKSEFSYVSELVIRKTKKLLASMR